MAKSHPDCSVKYFSDRPCLLHFRVFQFKILMYVTKQKPVATCQLNGNFTFAVSCFVVALKLKVVACRYFGEMDYYLRGAHCIADFLQRTRAC